MRQSVLRFSSQNKTVGQIIEKPRVFRSCHHCTAVKVDRQIILPRCHGEIAHAIEGRNIFWIVAQNLTETGFSPSLISLQLKRFCLFEQCWNIS